MYKKIAVKLFSGLERKYNRKLTSNEKGVIISYSKEMELKIRFLPSIRKIYRHVVNDYIKIYNSEQNINYEAFADHYSHDFSYILREIYHKCNKVFGFAIRNELDKKRDLLLSGRKFKSNNEYHEQRKEIDSDIATELTYLRVYLIKRSIDSIQKTIANDLLNYTDKTKTLYTIELYKLKHQLLNLQHTKEYRKIGILKQQIAKLENDKNLWQKLKLKSLLTYRFISRADLVTSQEVGLASQISINTEAETISKRPDKLKIGGISILYKKLLIKEWCAILDKRTRTAHIGANGQRRNANQSFLVGGEMLRYPLDPNGSVDNTIRCRCRISYNMDI